MTSKRNSKKAAPRKKIEVMVGCSLSNQKLHAVVYIDGWRFKMSAEEANGLRKSLKKAVKYIRSRP
mgnify:CR=1 FL=1